MVAIRLGTVSEHRHCTVIVPKARNLTGRPRPGIMWGGEELSFNSFVLLLLVY
jgi:hypothetical protein